MHGRGFVFQQRANYFGRALAAFEDVAAGQIERRVLRVVAGQGMAMVDIADIAMLFVRCRGGISHHPDEHVDAADAAAGARVLLRLIENFKPRDVA